MTAYYDLLSKDSKGIATTLAEGMAQAEDERLKRERQMAAQELSRRMAQAVNDNSEKVLTDEKLASLATTGRDKLETGLKPGIDRANESPEDYAARINATRQAATDKSQAANLAHLDWAPSTPQADVDTSNAFIASRKAESERLNGSGVTGLADSKTDPASFLPISFLKPAQKEVSADAWDKSLGEKVKASGADAEYASMDTIQKNPATSSVVDGRAFPTKVAARNYWDDKLRKDAESTARGNYASDLGDVEKMRETAIANIKGAGLQSALKEAGLKPEDITDAGIATAEANVAKKVAEVQAQYDAEVAGLRKKGMKGAKLNSATNATRKRLNELLALKGNLKAVGSNYYEAKTTSEQGVSADARSLLEAMQVTNPMPEDVSPMRLDRLREQEVQRQFPTLLTIAQADPAAARLIYDSFKMDSKQGDAGLAMDQKSAQAQADRQTRLITSYKSMERMAQAAKDRMAELDKKIESAERIAKDRNAAAWQRNQANVNLGYWKTQRIETNKTAMKIRDSQTALERQAMASGDYYTPQGRQYLTGVLGTLDSGAADYDAASVAGYKSDLYADGQARPTTKGLTNTSKPGTFSFSKPKTEIEVETVGPPDTFKRENFPRLHKDKKAGKDPVPPKGWTSPRKLTDGTWIAKDPVTKTFKRFN